MLQIFKLNVYNSREKTSSKDDLLTDIKNTKDRIPFIFQQWKKKIYKKKMVPNSITSWKKDVFQWMLKGKGEKGWDCIYIYIYIYIYTPLFSMFWCYFTNFRGVVTFFILFDFFFFLLFIFYWDFRLFYVILLFFKKNSSLPLPPTSQTLTH